MEVLFILGVCVLIGLGGARLFKLLRIPQVVGYLAAGVVLGGSVFGFMRAETLDELSPLVSFALGLIGFMIGTELRISAIRNLARSILAILFAESLGAFVLVATGVSLLTGSVAEGLLFGALSCATAPAATVDVLWEYKAKGILTTVIFAIVGLDDAVGVIMYAGAMAVAEAQLGVAGSNLFISLLGSLREIALSIILGGFLGGLLTLIGRKAREPDVLITLMVGFVLAGGGMADAMGLSLILTCMAIGFVYTNFAPEASSRTSRFAESFNIPVYILFFVMTGARLQLANLPTLGLIGIIYLSGRTIGKFLGSYFGGKASGADRVVRNYLGLALFSQAGVAIGLSIAAQQELYSVAQHLADPVKAETIRALGDKIINVITATTFFVQVIGPPCVKLAIKKAGEIGRA